MCPMSQPKPPLRCVRPTQYLARSTLLTQLQDISCLASSTKQGTESATLRILRGNIRKENLTRSRDCLWIHQCRAQGGSSALHLSQASGFTSVIGLHNILHLSLQPVMAPCSSFPGPHGSSCWTESSGGQAREVLMGRLKLPS